MSIDSVSSTTTNFYTPSVTSTAQSTTTSEVSATSSTDEISLSGTSELSPETIISSLAPEGIDDKYTSSGTIDVAAVREDYQEKVTSLTNEFNEKFAEYGISDDDHLTIKVYMDGSYEVEAEPEVKEKIEKMLAENPDLVSSTVETAQMSKFMYALDVASAYVDACQNGNSEAAFNRCMDLMKEGADDAFVLEYKDGAFLEYAYDNETEEKVLSWNPWDGFLTDPFADLSEASSTAYYDGYAQISA